VRSARFGHAVAVLGLYTAIALWFTRPLASHFTDHVLAAHPLTDYDIPFNVWVMAWVTHALTTRPLHLFDANIYHPAPDALAYAEHWLGSMPFFAPGYLATANAVVGVNLMMLAGLVLSAAGVYFVVWRWSGSWVAALVAGLLFGFYPAHLRPLGPNLVTLQYIPFALFFLDRVVAGGRWPATIGLTFALLGQCLASLYYAYPVLLATGAAVAGLCLTRAFRPRAGDVLRVGVAVAVPAAVVTALSPPYFRVAARGLETMYAHLTPVLNLPTPVLRLLREAIEPFGPLAAVLAGFAVVLAPRSTADSATRRRITILLVWIAVGLVLFAGRTLTLAGHELPMPSRLLDRFAPGFAVLRDRRRFLVIVLAPLSVLAGLGIARIAALLRSPRARRWTEAAIGGAAALVILGSIDRSPCRLKHLPTGSTVPAAYRALAGIEPGPVLELPVGARNEDLGAARLNAEYEYFSTVHWHQLLNGYTSFWPRQIEATMAMARALPARHALDDLVNCTGVEWILVHRASLAPVERPRWSASVDGLTLRERFGDDLLYRVDRAQAGACITTLFDGNDDRTLEGTPRTSVAAADRRAVIEAVTIPREIAHAYEHVGPMMAVALQAWVTIRNAGTRVWPGVGVGDAGLVRVSYEWIDPRGRVVRLLPALRTPMPVDLRPGEAIDMPIAFHIPFVPGDYGFKVVVDQGPDAPFETTGPGAAPVGVAIRRPPTD
jgi:hypothetical protein